MQQWIQPCGRMGKANLRHPERMIFKFQENVSRSGRMTVFGERWFGGIESVSELNHDIASRFDGGETGCGELLLDLLLFMRQQPAGAIVEVRALDPGAPLEIPAWCRMTQYQLLSCEHPFYYIQRPTNSQFEKA